MEAKSHLLLGLADAAIVRRMSFLIEASNALVGTFFSSFLRLSIRGVL